LYEEKRRELWSVNRSQFFFFLLKPRSVFSK
jgi:hypothetical protein